MYHFLQVLQTFFIFIIHSIYGRNEVLKTCGLVQAFFEAHPEFAGNDFFVTGESYAGHYVPAVTSRIHKGNKANEGLHINLKV